MARDPDEIEAEGLKCCLHDFELYATRSNFYMIGKDQSRTHCRVLKIDRSEPAELNFHEDSTTYSERECNELLKRIDEGNRSTGGLKFVTNCYGIVGFVKFLGPYYMLLITKRRAIGVVCGHTVYAVSKNRMIALSNSNLWSNIPNAYENRYKRLLCTVDLTKDFFFSYSYHIMQSLQKNMCESQAGLSFYESMFVWNEFLTRGIRNHLKSTLWTVPLVYGFFKQAKLSVSGKVFKLTLIARRSRHYAGTRYLKRGVNEKGKVANDVETEQIVFEDIPVGVPTRVCSVVQNRGSIPLYWSQETSKLIIKPDIVLKKKDDDYEATRLHFENLVNRYGNPIIILNLIKSEEKKPRESILRSEFANAIETINKDLPDEDQLKFLHWDLHKHSRSKAKSVLTLLGKVAENVLNLTGFFFCEVTPALAPEGTLGWQPASIDDATDSSCSNHGDNSSIHANNTGDSDMSADGSQEEDVVGSDAYGLETPGAQPINSSFCSVKPLKVQKGVLRTNCIDCLDRTNVAQYAYGLAALGHQLHALEFLNDPKIDLDAPLADDLMSFYERMGDTLALQYGGSAAHNKIFCERRGQWKAATQSQEFFRTLQRYYSNAYVDAEKQAAINLFLGYFQPEKDKPALWELDFDQHYNIGIDDPALSDKNGRAFMKRSKSDASIFHKNNTPYSLCNNCRLEKLEKSLLSAEELKDERKILSESTPEISLYGGDLSYSRNTPTASCRHFAATENNCTYARMDSNFLDLDWLSSDYSVGEDILDRARVMDNPTENVSTKNVLATISTQPMENGTAVKEKQHSRVPGPCDATQSSSDALTEFSDSFVHWVINGDTLWN